MLPESEQLKDALKKSRHVLIALPKDFSADALASALGLFLLLGKMGKLVTMSADQFAAPANLRFLPGVSQVQPALRNLQKFIITVDVNKDAVEEFSYDLENGKLKIFITPKNGSITPEQLTTETSNYIYDLIITLDCPDFESLGGLFKNNTEFFYTTTIINIDHKPGNEQYGQINITNPNACATAELVYQVAESLGKELMDKDAATCLLTGLISKTKSFKTITVTPAALDIASALMQAGADQNAIIKALYRSRTISTINLWGRVLARLKSHDGNKLVWSMINQDDFMAAGATEEDLPDVIEELISFIPGVEIVTLLYQSGQQADAVGVLTKVFKNHNALYLTKAFAPEGTKEAVRFAVKDKSLVDAQNEVIAKIKEQLERAA